MPEKRVIDTRGGGNVNLGKYDERFDRLAGAHAGDNVKRGKEKFQNKQKQRQQQAAASAKRRAEERERMQKLQFEIAKKAQLKVQIPDTIGVGELASRMKKTGAEVVRALIKNGVMASLSDIIDYDTAALVAMELGCKVEHEVVVTVEEKLIDDSEDKPEDLVPRAPVVVVMGHVDHGKTSLLDYIRNAHVAAGEAGGITQHIGAYTVNVKGSPITFLDTPGHEAFTSMRARGASVTDIAILVVAANDGIMPQTIESINHAKAAEHPHRRGHKQDGYARREPGAREAAAHGVRPRQRGVGRRHHRLPDLRQDRRGHRQPAGEPGRPGRGATSSRRTRTARPRAPSSRRGSTRAAAPIMTVLVQNGTLHQGDIIIAGTAVGRVRTMVNDKGQRVNEAGPSTPVEIAGMTEVPGAGDTFNAVADERMARELVEERKQQAEGKDPRRREEGHARRPVQPHPAGRDKGLQHHRQGGRPGQRRGRQAPRWRSSPTTRSACASSTPASAPSTESDVMLAAASGAIIVGFNVRPDTAARDYAAEGERRDAHVPRHLRLHQRDRGRHEGHAGPEVPTRQVIGHVEIRQLYKVCKVGHRLPAATCTDGKVQRGCKVRVVRDGIVIFEGEMASLRRFKDDVKEVAAGYECGIQIEKFNDEREGDIIEAYVMKQIEN